jgi:hypothetical protein
MLNVSANTSGATMLEVNLIAGKNPDDDSLDGVNKGRGWVRAIIIKPNGDSLVR